MQRFCLTYALRTRSVYLIRVPSLSVRMLMSVNTAAVYVSRTVNAETYVVCTWLSEMHLCYLFIYYYEIV